MFCPTRIFRAAVLFFGCIALLSTTTVARVLPKIKRDNATCCAFKITNRDNIRFRYEHIVDFSTMTSLDQVYGAGWGISNGWQIGGANPKTGQVGWADEKNVKIVPGVGLTLTVPGRQSPTASTFSGAEITFPWATLGGYFEVEAKVSSVPGAVFGMFTWHADPWDAPLGWQDEQDIEILTSSLLNSTPYNAPGIQLTNFDPFTGEMIETVTPFPSDPSTAFHKYSMSWLPTLPSCPALSQPGSRTQYRYDGANLNNPPGAYAVHPSTFIINTWTNADPGFSVGPPTADVVITIKRVRAYFDKPNRVADNACPIKGAFDCTVAMACGVTMS